jgi:hypothetical protein
MQMTDDDVDNDASTKVTGDNADNKDAVANVDAAMKTTR